MPIAVPGRCAGLLLAMLVAGGLPACSREDRGAAPATAAPAPEAVSAPEAASTADSSPATSGEEGALRLTSPRPGQALKSPLTVTGAAPGNWYFEASFPVTLLDGNGAVLARAPARAKGTWMTADYVGFTATLVFAAPATAEGELLLQNDNPSGEAGKSRYVRIPVVFAGSAGSAIGTAAN